VFPIMLQQLFNKVGFGWAVRISAFVCLACGIIATALVSSRLPKRKPGPWVDVSSLKDANYAIFVLGSAISCLGKPPRSLPFKHPSHIRRYLRTNVLHRPIRPRTQHLPNPRIRCPLNNERRQRIRTHRPINPSRPNRKVQHPDPIHSPNGHIHPRTMASRTGSSVYHHIFRLLRVLLWFLVRAPDFVYCTDIEDGEDWGAYGDGV
jgi:hypothetical protein